MKVEEWNGYRIRFIEKDGEWWAILKDICDALNLKRSNDISQRLDPDMLTKVKVVSFINLPDKYKTEKDNAGSNGITFSDYNRVTTMLAVNELGIYEALFASRRLEARKFRKWAASVMIRLRRFAGLEGYEVMQMTEKEVQDTIDCLLDDMFYDDVNDKVMVSVTVAGGDVEQMELDDYIREVEEMRRENQ